jgi:hypothetical protein
MQWVVNGLPTAVVSSTYVRVPVRYSKKPSIPKRAAGGVGLAIFRRDGFGIDSNLRTEGGVP